MDISISASLAAQNHIFEREFNLFPFAKFFSGFLEWLLKYYIKHLNKLLDKSYVLTKGVINVIESYTPDQALRELPTTKRALKLMILINGRFEQEDYFGNKELASKINLVIDVLYDVDILIKEKAYSKNRSKPTDPAILNYLASSSKEALQIVLNR